MLSTTSRDFLQQMELAQVSSLWSLDKRRSCTAGNCNSACPPPAQSEQVNELRIFYRSYCTCSQSQEWIKELSGWESSACCRRVHCMINLPFFHQQHFSRNWALPCQGLHRLQSWSWRGLCCLLPFGGYALLELWSMTLSQWRTHSIFFPWCGIRNGRRD